MSSLAVEQARHRRMLIGGNWVDASDDGSLESVDPSTAEVWATVPEATEADVNAAVQSARTAFEDGPWARMTGSERARLMHRLADLIADRAHDLAVTETRDNGKLLREMEAQVESMPGWYRYFAGAADKIHGDTIPSDKSNFLLYSRPEPVGVVAAVLPWNSPLLLLTWKLAPALAAGCTLIAKPAEQTPVSTLEFAAMFDAAGFPPGVFNVVTGRGATTGRSLVRHPGVDKVAFTGSTATGVSVMRDAAEHMARVSLELGGKSPNIVFADADLDEAVDGAVAGIFAAAGQTCVAGSRLLVEDDVYDDFLAAFLGRAEQIRLGNPLDPATEMGPLAFKEHLERVLGRIQAASEEGAVLAYGGGQPRIPGLENGYYVEPTVFANVDNEMRLAQEEIFGPVAGLIKFRGEEEAIRIANSTRYGLAAGVWTGDIRRGHRVAHAIRAGTVWINAYRAVSFDAPFGGYRMSGFGRENGLDALHEYTELKTVWVELQGQGRDPFRVG